MRQFLAKQVALACMVLLTLSLTSCGEHRAAAKYLEGLSKAALPAIQQGKVVSELIKTTRPTNFVATWPVLRKNIEDLKTQVEAAEPAVKSLTVPPTANTLQQLVLDDVGILHDLCLKSLDAGDRVCSVGTGLPALRKLGELKPEIDEVKQLSARHVELSTKIQNEIANLKATEKIP